MRGTLVEVDGETIPDEYQPTHVVQVSRMASGALADDPGTDVTTTVLVSLLGPPGGRAALFGTDMLQPLACWEVQTKLGIHRHEMWAVTALVRYALGRLVGNAGDGIVYALYEPHPVPWELPQTRAEIEAEWEAREQGKMEVDVDLDGHVTIVKAEP